MSIAVADILATTLVTNISTTVADILTTTPPTTMDLKL